MNFNKLELFQAQGPYFRTPDGELDPDLPEYGVGECQSMGNRGGGNEEGKGMPGFVVVGPKQIAWAAELMTGFLGWQPAERFVGHVFCAQLVDVSWHRGTILRFTYRALDQGSADGLFLAEFVDHESVLSVRHALEWQMEPFPSA